MKRQKNHPKGIWTLPPTLKNSKKKIRVVFEIETDRMTLNLLNLDCKLLIYNLFLYLVIFFHVFYVIYI